MLEQYKALGVSDAVLTFGEGVLADLKDRFAGIDAIAEANQMKVIAAMQKNRLAANHFNLSSGYGYDDEGRDTLERVYADCFGAEAALVRPQITCGTHALALALGANLLPGDELLSPVGGPYDTLEEVIGIRPSAGSLKEYGVSYRQVDLLPDGSFDYDGIRAAIGPQTKLITIQRSKGYATRPSFSVDQIGQLIAFCKQCKPDVICMVDNCYGEFTELREPSDVGADMIVGSLIKNPGGGLAPTGGYVCGRADLIDRCARRLSAPGLGREVGANLGLLTQLYQGFFLSPTVTASAVKGFEIGAGFGAATATGLTNNDAFCMENGHISKRTNYSGGTLGGMSDGSLLFFRAAVKPTPSIAATQQTVNKDGKEIEISIKGRHDPIIVPRAVVVVEAMTAITILDALLSNMTARLDRIIDFYRQ